LTSRRSESHRREGGAPTLRARLDALHDRDQALASDLAAKAHTAADTQQAVADRLDHVIAQGEPEQAKALLTIPIAELRVESRSEILPTVSARRWFCAPNNSVEPTGIEPVTSCLQSRRSPS
jgi:hypothetical protein